MSYDEQWLTQQLRKPGYRLVGGTAHPPLPAHAPEGALQGRLQQLCGQLGYLFYHAYKSQKSTPGLPDCLVIVPDDRPENNVLYAWELKAQGEHPSPAQRRWLEAFAKVRRVETGVYYPKDWPQLVELLRRQG